MDLTETQVPQILGTLISTWSLAAIAIGLRVIAHRLKGNSLWLEDYLVFFSLVRLVLRQRGGRFRLHANTECYRLPLAFMSLRVSGTVSRRIQTWFL